MSTLLPPSSTKLMRDVAVATQPDLSPKIAELWDPETCPEHALPWLAWALHITDAEGWRLAKTAEQRRVLISQSFALHRKKGTPWSIRQALKSIGFNDAELLERLPINRFNSALTYAGAVNYDAYGWAQFRVGADVGDSQPITSANTALIVETIEEWKPARCHLVDVQYRASVTEAVASDEQGSLNADLSDADGHKWGRSYNGAFAYDQAALHFYNGARRFDGQVAYSAFHRTGIAYDAQRESDGMAAALGVSDRQARHTLYDGFADYSGALDFGAADPVAEDPPMVITLTRHLHYDGRMNYAANRYSGQRRYSGDISYIGNVGHQGDVVTTLEA